MKKVILSLAQTYDGYISRLDGTVDYLTEVSGAVLEQFNSFMQEVEVVIMGRTTFNEYNKYGWDYLKGKRIIVLSSKPSISKGIEFYNGDLIELVKSINKTIWCFGGTKVIKSFLEARLIDEFQITTVPKLIGKGKRVFELGDYDIDLTLIKSINHNNIVTTIYRVKR